MEPWTKVIKYMSILQDEEHTFLKLGTTPIILIWRRGKTKYFKNKYQLSLLGLLAKIKV